MLKAEDMSKLRIICPKNKLKTVINKLYKAKAIDLIEHRKDEALDIGSPLAGSEALSDTVIKARSIIFHLGLKKKNVCYPDEIPDMNKKSRSINLIHKEVFDIDEKLKNIDVSLKNLRENHNRLKAIESIGTSIELYKETELLKYFVGYIDNIDHLKRDLKKNIDKGYEISHSKTKKRDLVSIFIDRQLDNHISTILRKHNFSELKIPEGLREKNSTIKNFDKDIEKLKKERSQLHKKLGSIIETQGNDILAIEHALSVNVKKAEVPLSFAETENISIISGWVPLKNKAKLISGLNKAVSENIDIEELEIKKGDEVPVKLNNPAIAKPYEFLLRLFSVPSYKEMDPSIFMFFTFPLFFGFMLGDIGYGLITLVVFTLLKRYIPEGKDLLNIMVFCSLSSIFFGIIFGEFFGFELMHFHFFENFIHHILPQGLHYPFIHRSADTAIELITISLIVGFIHVNLGLVFGFINMYKAHGFKHAIFEKGSWFLLEFGAFMIVLSALGVSRLRMWVNFLIIIISAIMLYKGEGVKGIVELPSVFIHIGSYMRLMAIGLASVGLAMVINQQTGPLFSKGIIGIIGGIVIFTLGHTLNILLGIIGPFLHSLRLHYVEHFTKFYEGGGTEFEPFGAEDN